MRITASEGTSRTDSEEPYKVAVASMPARSFWPGLGSSTRTRRVRLSGSASAKTDVTLPFRTVSGAAVSRASTTCPIARLDAWACGKASSSQTVPNPVMRARVMPGLRLMPWRTINSESTPAVGTVMVVIGKVRLLSLTRWITAGGIPSNARRWRAAWVSAASPMALTARNSCCAPAHSGLKTSARGLPAAMTSPGARA